MSLSSAARGCEEGMQAEQNGQNCHHAARRGRANLKIFSMFHTFE
jgi:hypothetical protein